MFIFGTFEEKSQIFYNVDPSHVRNQTGNFGKAMAQHEKNKKEKVQKWSEALTHVANLSGFHSLNKCVPVRLK